MGFQPDLLGEQFKRGRPIAMHLLTSRHLHAPASLAVFYINLRSDYFFKTRNDLFELVLSLIWKTTVAAKHSVSNEDYDTSNGNN